MTNKDLVGAADRWIPEAEYKLIQNRVPILCADFIPLSYDRPSKVGLIWRETHDDHQGWCVVGGAVLRNEPLSSAVERHLHATLGNEVHIESDSLHLLDVIEYFTKSDIGAFHDPRKHAVAVTYFGRCSGPIRPCGEALDFRWFEQEELTDIQFGFGQDGLIERLLNHSEFGQG